MAAAQARTQRAHSNSEEWTATEYATIMGYAWLQHSRGVLSVLFRNSEENEEDASPNNCLGNIVGNIEHDSSLAVAARPLQIGLKSSTAHLSTHFLAQPCTLSNKG